MAILFFNFGSFGFLPECLGQHEGAADLGNLGDVNGLGQSLLHIILLSFSYISCTVNSAPDLWDPLELWKFAARILEETKQ